MSLSGALLPLGERAWLLPASSARGAAALATLLRRLIPEAIEVVAGFSSVVVVHDGSLEASFVASLDVGDLELDGTPRRHIVPVVLDGPDVPEALARTSLTFDELREAIARASFEVAVVGFSPGFAYLAGLDGPLTTLSRRATPRPRVPAGSFALAAGMAAIYPQATPGGWWLLGRSSTVLFDATRDEPALFAPGDLVEFDVVEDLEPGQVDGTERPPLEPPPGVAPALKVISAPPLCCVVDEGRRGVAHLGVPCGGPADPERALIARLLVGGSSSIEVSAPGLELEVLADVVVALVDLGGTVDGRTVPDFTPLALSVGQRLVVSSVGRGQRGYLGVSGGALTAPVLGSMVTDALSSTGPGFLAPGDLLGAGGLSREVRTTARLAGDPSPVRLRFVEGPHATAAGSIDGVLATLSVTSSKVGLRFDPVEGPIVVSAPSIESMPVVTGTLQLPPDGRPVMLGPDHATLGGYPIVGVVIEADLGRAGRLSPGDSVIFESVSLDEARSAALQRAAVVAGGIGPRGSSSQL
jgi:KipI family sensor histidine kinase inhibitor